MGIEPGAQDVLHKWIHWAMVAPLSKTFEQLLVGRWRSAAWLKQRCNQAWKEDNAFQQNLRLINEDITTYLLLNLWKPIKQVSLPLKVSSVPFLTYIYFSFSNLYQWHTFLFLHKSTFFTYNRPYHLLTSLSCLFLNT